MQCTVFVGEGLQRAAFHLGKEMLHIRKLPVLENPSSAGRQEASSAGREMLLYSSGARLARLLESEPIISSYSPSLSV